MLSNFLSLLVVCAQLGETPLHFACKFGFAEMVAVLISHPGTDKQLRNVDGLTAKDVCLFFLLPCWFLLYYNKQLRLIGCVSYSHFYTIDF